ncbi:MAG: MarR family transcriptional regulator [Parvibaculum sp.]|nr:MarR family transcriptional regulator [Parvibaculum sp.]
MSPVRGDGLRTGLFHALKKLHQIILIHQNDLMYKGRMNISAASTPTPSDFLQLAGHPLRWRLLGELARSDRIVLELTERVGQPQNLVSYHLGKLRDGGLVFARRSSADRRDTYYGLDLARIGKLLAAAGGALHPGLRLQPAGKNPDAVRPAKVLFLCTGNSARSQMAEALIRERSGGAIDAHSAGSDPKSLHPNAVRAMQEKFGIDISAQMPKHLDLYVGETFDRVVSLCDRVREACPRFQTETIAIHWSVANPATGEADDITYPLFERTAEELAERIDFLIAALSEEES